MRLIDGDALENQFGVSDADLLALDEIRHAPTIDAEVVMRCKDCKHEFGGRCSICGFQKRKPDDFCSYGEMKN